MNLLHLRAIIIHDGVVQANLYSVARINFIRFLCGHNVFLLCW